MNTRTRASCALGFLVSMPSSVMAAVPFRTVALSGQQPPGTSAGVSFATFDQFEGPAIDAAGRVAIWATLTGAAVSGANDSGIWSEGGGSLKLVARKGNHAPGTAGGVVFSTFNSPKLNSAGRMAFTSSVSGPGVDSTNDRGIWSEGPGVLALVAREGSPAPGMAAGVNFGTLNDYVVLGSGGTVAFGSELTGTGVNSLNGFGIWSGGPNGLTLVARRGDPAPGITAGAIFYSVMFCNTVNGAGRTAFFSLLAGTGLDSSNDEGLWSDVSGVLTLVARKGSPAPGTPAGVSFERLDGPSLNNTGRIVFAGSLSGTGVDSSNRKGVWSDGPGILTLIARTGAPAPGTPAGVSFSILSTPRINGAGQVAFHSALTGSGVISGNSRGIWSEGPGVLTLIARTGNPAPGVPAGVTFGGFNDTTAFNGAGRVAFFAYLSGSSVSESNDESIWIEGPGGLLQIVIREGEQIAVAPGDIRTVSALSVQRFPAGESGGSSFLNDASQIAFRAEFTDGTQGVFVTIGPDADGDGVNNAFDGCPSDPNKTAAGVCGCGSADADSDGDGTANCNDGCPNDASKTSPGSCGCGAADFDSDGDGTADCVDGCAGDATKIAVGACGCGTADVDSDGDGTPDCVDACPENPNLIEPSGCGGCGGACGVGMAVSTPLVGLMLGLGKRRRRAREAL